MKLDDRFLQIIREEVCRVDNCGYICGAIIILSMALSASMQKELPRVRACLAQHPVERAWIFGSFSRGEEREDSDVDFLVKLDKTAKLSLLGFIHIKNQLADMLGREVDLVEDGYLLPFAAQTANQDKILVYERNS